MIGIGPEGGEAASWRGGGELGTTPMWPLFFWILVVVEALSGGDKKVSKRGKPQTFPDTYPESGRVRSPSEFNAFIRKNQHAFNLTVPSPETGTVRLMKLNVHLMRDVLSKPGTADMLKPDLYWLQATILAIQEVPKPGQPYHDSLASLLATLGYKHQAFHACKKAILGNMIASRIPIKESQYKKLDSTRNITVASFVIGGTTFAVFNTQTDSSSQDDVVDQFIKEHLEESLYNFYFVVWERRNEPPKKTVEEESSSPLIDDVFKVLSWSRPPFINWKGHSTDFIYVSRTVDIELLGAYLYLTPATNRMPMIVDFYVEGATTFAKFLGFAHGPLLVGLIAIIFLIIVTGVGIYHWIQSKLDPF